MSRILDRKFKYVPAAKTDIRKRFNKIAPGWNKRPTQPKSDTVVTLKKRKAA